MCLYSLSKALNKTNSISARDIYSVVGWVSWDERKGFEAFPPSAADGKRRIASFHLNNEAFIARTAGLVIQRDRVSRALYFREIPCAPVDVTRCIVSIALRNIDTNTSGNQYFRSIAWNIFEYVGYLNFRDIFSNKILWITMLKEWNISSA